MGSPNSELTEFIIFCIERSGKRWPDIYDELASWIKQLKKPLKTAIDNIEDLGVELYGWQ